MLLTILAIILLLAFFGMLPMWSHAASWGYGPSGLTLLVLVVLVVVLLRRRGDTL
jgi:hypothetical protein